MTNENVSALMDLTGRIAIVTGGTGHLGSVMCLALAELGARVFAVSRGQSADFSTGHPNIEILRLDLSSEAGVDSLVATVLDHAGCIDILVNNAYTWPKTVDFMQASWDEMHATLETGVVSQLCLTRAVLKHMIPRRRGSIINISSMYGKVSPDHRIYRDSLRGNAIDYGASKAAILQATRYIASISGKHGVRCNSISPGPFPRAGTFDGAEWFRDELSARTMLGRPGDAHEIKGAVVFLASDMSSYVTGTDIAVDGGWTSW
jgi:NAD(P)-dependent dehydrogenase (short-subunit alcohol dehydrogenase family)